MDICNEGFKYFIFYRLFVCMRSLQNMWFVASLDTVCFNINHEWVSFLRNLSFGQFFHPQRLCWQEIKTESIFYVLIMCRTVKKILNFER